MIGGKENEVWNESLKKADTVSTLYSARMAVGIVLMFHHSQSVPSWYSICEVGYVSVR